MDLLKYSPKTGHHLHPSASLQAARTSWKRACIFVCCRNAAQGALDSLALVARVVSVHRSHRNVTNGETHFLTGCHPRDQCRRNGQKRPSPHLSLKEVFLDTLKAASWVRGVAAVKQPSFTNAHGPRHLHTPPPPPHKA